MTTATDAPREIHSLARIGMRLADEALGVAINPAATDGELTRATIKVQFAIAMSLAALTEREVESDGR